MKTKIKFVSMTLKVALLGMMAFAFVACSGSKENVETPKAPIYKGNKQNQVTW